MRLTVTHRMSAENFAAIFELGRVGKRKGGKKRGKRKVSSSIQATLLVVLFSMPFRRSNHHFFPKRAAPRVWVWLENREGGRAPFRCVLVNWKWLDERW